MTESIPALVDMIRRRIGQDYDGEAHFAEHEALQIADALASLTAPDFCALSAKNPAPEHHADSAYCSTATSAELAQVQPAPAGMPGVEDVARLVEDAQNALLSGPEAAAAVLDLFAPLAQENERLKARLAERDGWVTHWQTKCQATNALLQEEKARATTAEARVAQAVEALERIKDHPEEYNDGRRSYAVGWAFWNVQNIARTAAAAIRGEK